MCTQLTKYKGGQIGLCDQYLASVDCEFVHWSVLQIRELCGILELGNRAGGKWKFNQYITTIVY